MNVKPVSINESDTPLNNIFLKRKKIVITPFDRNSLLKLQDQEITTPIHATTDNSMALYNESFKNHKGFSSKFRGKIIDHRKLIEELQKISGVVTPLLKYKNQLQVSPKKLRPIKLTKLSRYKQSSHNTGIYSVDKVLNKHESIFEFNQDLIINPKRMNSQNEIPNILNSSNKAGRQYLFNLYNNLMSIEKKDIVQSELPKPTHKRFSSIRRNIAVDNKEPTKIR